MGRPPDPQISRERDTEGMEAMWRLALDGALAMLIRALARRGIHPLLLKGPSFARWLYDDPTARPYGDIDLLIAPADFAAARRTISELGFMPERPAVRVRVRPDHHEVWRRGRAGALRVELHRTVFLVTAPPSLVWRRFSDRTEKLEIAGVEVNVPGEAARALIVGLHAAQHGTAVSKPRSDLDRALARVEPDVWHEAATLARELGAAPAFEVGLGLSPRGHELAERLGLPGGEAARAVRLRAGTPGGAAMAFDWFVEQLLSTRGVRPRLALVGRQLVPSRAWMLAGYPIARRSGRGLAIAYLMRPVRIAVMLPGGLGAWLKVALPPRRWSRSRRG